MGKLTAPRQVYTAIRVRDMKRSIAFYTGALGMKCQFQFKIKETGGRVAYLKSPGGKQNLELNWYPGSKPYRKGDELDHLGFKVPDLKAAHAALVAHGARVTIPTFREGSVRLTFYEDPDGIPLEIVSNARGRFRAK
jgi:lactoylglutathione lyase